MVSVSAHANTQGHSELEELGPWAPAAPLSVGASPCSSLTSSARYLLHLPSIAKFTAIPCKPPGQHILVLLHGLREAEETSGLGWPWFPFRATPIHPGVQGATHAGVHGRGLTSMFKCFLLSLSGPSRLAAFSPSSVLKSWPWPSWPSDFSGGSTTKRTRGGEARACPMWVTEGRWVDLSLLSSVLHEP